MNEQLVLEIHRLRLELKNLEQQAEFINSAINEKRLKLSNSLQQYWTANKEDI
jgi:hypothetical protein